MKIVIDRIHHDGSGYADTQEIQMKIYVGEELKFDKSVGNMSSWYSPTYTVEYPSGNIQYTTE